MIVFAEDHLPEGQKTIQTNNVKRCKAFMRLITDPERSSPTMGVITGLAGIGKTIATQDYLDSVTPHTHTALPTAIKVKVMPRSTPRALAKTVLDGLLEKPKGNNIYEMADEAALAIERNEVKLIVVDEADRLNEDSFDVLRHLYDKTGCPIVLVGLPNILRVIERHEKFSSRVGLRMHFLPLELKEVLTVVLPELVIPRWCYNPEQESDLLMGTEIWNKVNPSLRKLTNLLEIASQTARVSGIPSISKETIEEAFGWMATQADRSAARKKKTIPDKKTQGKHEQASDERRKGKQKPSDEEGHEGKQQPSN
jgi:DNA transposition AAA+ family ATPase